MLRSDPRLMNPLRHLSRLLLPTLPLSFADDLASSILQTATARQPLSRYEPQWHEPLPESVNVFPTSGTNCQS